MDYFIGLDIGTSSVKGMLLSENAIVKTAEREYPVYYPKDGWSEQNPQDWYDGSISVIKELVSDIDKNSVASVSFSGQMHGLVVLDENDNVIRPAILWNDSRSSRETEYLNNVIGKETLQQNTGNIAFSGFTAPKVLWLKNNEPENFQKTEKIMLPKDYVAYRLSGVFATDCSDAAGTLYFDTKNRCWSETMLSVLGISEKNLPKVYESYQTVGTLKTFVADELGLNENVKIVIGAGDNAASAVGTDTIKSVCVLPPLKSNVPLSILVCVPVCVIVGLIAVRSVPTGRFRVIVLFSSSILPYLVTPSAVVTEKELATV